MASCGHRLPQSGGAERAGPERPSALPPRLSLQIGHGSGAQAQCCPAGLEEAVGHSCLPFQLPSSDFMSSQPLAQQARPESCGGRQKRWKKCQLSFRNIDFTCGCRALKAWGRGGLFKIHVSSGVSSGENEALGGSSYSLDYELHREDGPCRGYEHQGVPPLLHRVPVRIRKAHLGTGVKGRFSPHRAPRKSQLPPEIKLQTEELHCLRGELSHIKAQVDRLLEHVELMEQQRDQLPGTEDCEQNRGSGSQGSLCRTTEPRQEPRGPRARPEAEGSQEHTDPEALVKNQASDQGCQ
ncbi:hypothetical protein AB1E18_012880 [Capra hircus]